MDMVDALVFSIRRATHIAIRSMESNTPKCDYIIVNHYTLSGGDGGEATPVPMPNTAVKLSSADGSWTDVP